MVDARHFAGDLLQAWDAYNKVYKPDPSGGENTSWRHFKEGYLARLDEEQDGKSRQEASVQ